MKKVLFALSLIAVMVSCSKSPADEAVAIFENAEKELIAVDSYKAYGDALLNFAKEADAFVKANKDFKPQGDDLKKIQEAEAKVGKAMETATATLEKKYEGKEEEAMGEALAIFGVLADLEKNYPDAKDFSFAEK
ncbi:MAG: hypothetical protein J6W49_01825 [Paludibacteraceae bacterium]|nr:hypothetical protein [Paludibacteraceae bacterium]MBP5136741.1 hypothetical protein [Paludibacteraceae bacterium]MBP5742163.1 hypothetical protein [Paludibacteraceae bacterium]